MSKRQLATPNELIVPAVIYKREVSGLNDHGQTQYTYVKRRDVLLKEVRQKASSETLVHDLSPTYQSMLVGNWWDLKDVCVEDIIVYGDQDLQVGLKAAPVNWQQRNRWGILEIATNPDCLYSQGVDSCNCTDKDRTPPEDMPVDSCETE